MEVKQSGKADIENEENKRHPEDKQDAFNNNNKENKETKPNKRKTNSDAKVNTFFIVCIIGVSLGILLEIINAQNRRQKDTNKYWVYSYDKDVHNKNGLLKHVHLVLERVGFEKSDNNTDWRLLWSHDYPFRVLFPNLHRLKPYQRVNHFPGTGFITNKVDLAISNSKYIPKAFKLPESKDKFLEYAEGNKHSMFLQKHNQHRGVYLKNVTQIDLSSGESFVQEYVQKPFLVDGHKFDIGVYVVLTSVNPLRAYWYKGDVLFRYCPGKYYPFDPLDLDKYVIGDDYLPTWKVPSLAQPYTAQGLSMKDAFDVYVRSKGKDPTPMWKEVENAIADILLKKEHHIIEALKYYPSADNFFEIMRFDLVLDDDLKVYLLEANMSPNLSSAHFPPNQLLYEQVLYNLFKLTGIAQQFKHGECQNEQQASQNMVSAVKNIAVWGDECNSICKERCDKLPLCGLCRPCLDRELRNSLLKAHTEFLHRGDFRRLFPPEMKPLDSTSALEAKRKDLNQNNHLQYLWYQGKCNTDVIWCT